ncbi:MAG: S8 family serine peptidase [Bdellovibrionota bacterium]|nr:S8 family serine peptidase [Bdellovibrionota bacterium]
MKIIVGMILAFSMQAMGATIAVIDSGVDVQHKDLTNNLWKNLVEIENNGRDEDRNGYPDDIYGWNFAESNNLVIDRSYLGTFSADPYLFFEIQGKMMLGTATEAELKWMNDKRKDPAFLQEMQKFGNFVHGTHVAGITVKGNTEGKILAVKLIPTEIKPFFQGLNQVLTQKDNGSQLDLDWRMEVLKAGLVTLAGEQMKLLEEIAAYVGNHKADIANGSFGTGFNQAKMITDNVFKLIFQRDPSADESDEVATFFLEQMLLAGKKMVAAAPNTLFVFAAGNDGSNNDKYPTSPTNIVADNVVSVAATYKYNFLAPFSNYGTKTVDVAAPGMLIDSQIPGNEYLKVSGTSQAAPYVANIAAQIKDTNTELSPLEIKKIIMGTVDYKEFLTAKVKAGGIVNLQRALQAAKLSLSASVEQAISEARVSIQDVEVEQTKSRRPLPIFAIEPIALPSQFR